MTRIEHDFIGDLEVPANAYYGVRTDAPEIEQRTTI